MAKQPETQEQDPTLEAAMQAELGVVKDASAANAPPATEPKEPPKEPAKPNEPEKGNEPTLDPFEESPEKPEAKTDDAQGEPDKANLSKKVEQQGYQIANVTKTLEKLTAAIEAMRQAPTEKRQERVEELQEQAQDQVSKLVDEGLIDPSIANIIRDLQSKSRPDKALKVEVESLKQQVMQQKRERDFDRQYPDLAGQFQKALAKAWEAADKRFPDMPDEQKRIYVEGKIYDIADAAVARIKQRKAASIEQLAAEPSSRPDTSTKGARVADQGAARPNKGPEKLTEAEEAVRWERELQADLRL